MPLIERNGFSAFLGPIWRRLCRASKTEFALDSLNIVAITYQFAASAWFAWARTEATTINPIYAWIFVLATCYSFAHRVWLKDLFKKKKWNIESSRRTQGIAIALSRLANGVRSNQFTPIELHQIELGLLNAMKSEVESLLGDSEGMYLAVNLIVEDHVNPLCLYALNRTNLDRELYKTYPKSDSMVAWKAMKTKARSYDADFNTNGEKPYRAILAFPIISHIGGKTKSVGAISIDSSAPRHFDGYEDKLELVLTPYIAMEKLVLTYRELSKIWRS